MIECELYKHFSYDLPSTKFPITEKWTYGLHLWFEDNEQDRDNEAATKIALVELHCHVSRYSALHVRLESKFDEKLFVLVMCDVALQCHSKTLNRWTLIEHWVPTLNVQRWALEL